MRVPFLNEKQLTYILIFIHGTANTTIGVSVLLWSNMGAESVLSQLGLPYWLWPSMFIGAGITGFAGVFNRMVAQFSFVFAAIVTSVFGVASLTSMIQGNLAATPSMVFLLYITYLKLTVAGMIQERDSVIQRMSEVTEIGQSALDGSNGTNS